MSLTIIGNINEEELTNTILNHLGLTREQAVEQIAEKLGVPLAREDEVVRKLNLDEQETLQRAAQILNRLS